MNLQRLAVLAAALVAATVQIPQSFAQARPLLVCSGKLAQASNMAWEQQRLEFSLDPSGTGQVTTLKADIGLLNATLLVERRDDALLGRESQPRSMGSNDRTLAISELKISRNTGAFTMVVSQFRDLDVLDGRSTWEGSCALKGAQEKKF